MDRTLQIVALLCALSYYAHGQFNPIAFTVGQHTHLEVAGPTTVPFGTAITINKDTVVQNGVFNCTIAGLYKFQVYSLTRSGNQLFLELYHNDAVVATMWGYTDSDYASAGNAVVLKLAVGDTVKVQTRDGYNVSLYGVSDEIYTTFTGVQVGSNAMVYSDLSFEEMAAFTVTLNHHEVVTGGTNVMYNTVVVDTDAGYDVLTGTYTVQKAGIYEFHFFSLTRQDAEVWQELYHNNQYVTSIYGNTDGEFSDDGNSVILHLQKGDTISVKAHDGNDNNLYGATDEIYTSLTGVQIMTEQAIQENELPVMAFSAGLSSSHSYADGDKVVFDRIFIDLPHNYDHTTGEFTAPLSGIYEFNFHAVGQQDKEIWLELFHNYKYVDSLYDHNAGYYPTAGNAAILKLDAGDVVYVRSDGVSDLYGASNEVYCTFSGYLLHALTTDPIIGRR